MCGQMRGKLDSAGKRENFQDKVLEKPREERD